MAPFNGRPSKPFVSSRAHGQPAGREPPRAPRQTDRPQEGQDNDSIGKLFTASLRRTDEGALGRALVEAGILLSASRGSTSQALRDAAMAYMFAGQMLIPIYLIRACGLSPSATGWLLAPLGLGMLCCYPLLGTLTKRFGIRRVSAGGALLAFAGTLPFLYLASHGLVLGVLASTLFIRGVGLSAVGMPSIASAYASVKPQELADGDNGSQYRSASWGTDSDDIVRNISRMEIGGIPYTDCDTRSFYRSISSSLRLARPLVCSRDETSSLTS